jgi:hypothetical protein
MDASLLRRLAALESRRPTGTGQWVRGLNGNVIWDPWDMDAPPDHDPGPGILTRLQEMAERLRADPDYKPPTEAEKAETMRRLDEHRERQRAERQAIRDFSDAYEAERRSRQ